MPPEAPAKPYVEPKPVEPRAAESAEPPPAAPEPAETERSGRSKRSSRQSQAPAKSDSLIGSWPSLVAPPSADSGTGEAAAPGAAKAAPAKAVPPPRTVSPRNTPVPPPQHSEIDTSTVKPGDENSIIDKLSPQGYIDFNSYEVETDGGATVRALDTRSGELQTLHFDRSGRMTTESGWQQ